jgi:hypothetical protein
MLQGNVMAVTFGEKQVLPLAALGIRTTAVTVFVFLSSD